MSVVVAYCRAGFERDCTAELVRLLDEQRMEAEPARVEQGSGYVVLRLRENVLWQEALAQLPSEPVVFARQLLVSNGLASNLDPADRVCALTEMASGFRTPFSDVWVETADAQASRPLVALCRRLVHPLRDRLREKRMLNSGRTRLPRLHVFLSESTNAYVCVTDPGRASPWWMGIPRLRMPREAPSRSVLKLEEALMTMLDERERRQLLRPGMSAVDLGAAPGGWSWLLAGHGMRVTAVDNGGMAPVVMRSGLVEHRREDGFAFRPHRRVDWMVCDIVEQPQRIAQRMAQWFANGWCRQSIFNLKLPMKRRYEMLGQCREVIEQAVRSRPHVLKFRQLYHDREEVTGCYRDLRR